MNAFLAKLYHHTITLSNLTLYHGTMRNDFSSYLFSKQPRTIWFTQSEEQAELHPLENRSKRYDKVDFPLVFKVHLVGPIRLINLEIQEDVHYLKDSRVPLFETFWEKELLREVAKERNMVGDTTAMECNILILDLIKRLGYWDGYQCRNDEDEIGLFLEGDPLFDQVQVKPLDLFGTLGETDIHRARDVIKEFKRCVEKLNKSYDWVEYRDYQMRGLKPLVYKEYVPLEMFDLDREMLNQILNK